MPQKRGTVKIMTSILMAIIAFSLILSLLSLITRIIRHLTSPLRPRSRRNGNSDQEISIVINVGSQSQKTSGTTQSNTSASRSVSNARRK